MCEVDPLLVVTRNFENSKIYFTNIVIQFCQHSQQHHLHHQHWYWSAFRIGRVVSPIPEPSTPYPYTRITSRITSNQPCNTHAVSRSFSIQCHQSSQVRVAAGFLEVPGHNT